MDRFTAHLDRAWDLISKGETLGALVSAKKALAIDAESPEALNLLGYIYALDGDFDEAISNYRQAMSLDEWYIDPILNTAELLVHSKADPEEAIRLCRSATEMVSGHEEYAEAVLLEVDALLNMGCVDEARKRLRDIEDPETLPPAFAMMMGRALHDAGDPSAAKLYVDRAIEQDPNCGDAWYYAGQIAQDEGRRIDAVRAYLMVLRADEASPSPPWAKYLEPAEPLVTQAIALLEEADRVLLQGTEIIVENAPTQEQIRHEKTDPRQVVFLDGVDSDRGVFEKIWFFVRNMARAGVMPNSAPADLAEIIVQEIRPRPGSD